MEVLLFLSMPRRDTTVIRSRKKLVFQFILVGGLKTVSALVLVTLKWRSFRYLQTGWRNYWGENPVLQEMELSENILEI